jgi:hypothetical protein
MASRVLHADIFEQPIKIIFQTAGWVKPTIND